MNKLTKQEIEQLSEEEYQDYLDEGYCDERSKQVDKFVSRIITEIEAKVVLQYDDWSDMVNAGEEFRQWFFRSESGYDELWEAINAALSSKRTISLEEE